MLVMTGPSCFPEEILVVASLLTHVNTQAMGLPRCQGVNVVPSCRRSSARRRPVGSSVTGILAVLKVSRITSLHMVCLVNIEVICGQTKACVP